MNLMKTSILLAALTALFGWVGWAIGGQQGMLVAIIMAGVMNLGAYWFSDKIVLSMYGAREINSGTAYQITHDLAQRAGLPMPRVYVIDSPQPNAFATGRSPRHAAIAVNTGLIEILTPRELAGVIAHELSHIKNRDTLIMTITATVAGAVSMLANFAFFFGGSRDQERQGPSPIVGLLVMILAPLAAALVQMAISRTREYSADKSGADICGDPLALADALRKLEQASLRIPNRQAEQNPATAHMFIVNPLHGQRMDNLFSTHPSLENRIQILQNMARHQVTPPPSSKAFKGPWS